MYDFVDLHLIQQSVVFVVWASVSALHSMKATACLLLFKIDEEAQYITMDTFFLLGTTVVL